MIPAAGLWLLDYGWLIFMPLGLIWLFLVAKAKPPIGNWRRASLIEGRVVSADDLVRIAYDKGMIYRRVFHDCTIVGPAIL